MEKVNLSELRKLIGTQVQVSGANWEVIEVIDRGPELVLESLSSQPDTPIQTNQYGEAHRRVPHTITIPVIDPVKGGYHPLFIETGLSEKL